MERTISIPALPKPNELSDHELLAQIGYNQFHRARLGKLSAELIVHTSELESELSRRLDEQPDPRTFLVPE